MLPAAAVALGTGGLAPAIQSGAAGRRRERSAAAERIGKRFVIIPLTPIRTLRMAETQLEEAPRFACGCAAHDTDDRKAIAVDPDAKTRNLHRLRRIEGQVRGLQKMIDEDRYC